MFRNNFLKFDYKTCSSGYAINSIRAWNKIYIYRERERDLTYSVRF